jgi:hypothetical protein
MAALRHHFPDARLIRRSEADATVAQKLGNYPRCRTLRDANVLSLKVFDFISYLDSDRMLLLDSDILFFQRPLVLLQRIMDPLYMYNTLNRDWGMGYSLEPAFAQSRVPFQLQSFINSGLGLMHKESYDLNCFEEWLSIPGILSHSHRIEQTLVALASSRFGHQFLPEEYDVQTNGVQQGQVVKHFTGPIRHLLYREGLARVFPKIQKLKSGYANPLSD